MVKVRYTSDVDANCAYWGDPHAESPQLQACTPAFAGTTNQYPFALPRA